MFSFSSLLVNPRYTELDIQHYKRKIRTPIPHSHPWISPQSYSWGSSPWGLWGFQSSKVECQKMRRMGISFGWSLLQWSHQWRGAAEWMWHAAGLHEGGPTYDSITNDVIDNKWSCPSAIISKLQQACSDWPHLACQQCGSCNFSPGWIGSKLPCATECLIQHWTTWSPSLQGPDIKQFDFSVAVEKWAALTNRRIVV